MDSPLSYIGGKSKLSKTIVDLIPEHTAYCEVFCGAGWVFFRKEPSRYEVINDLDSELVTFYRVLQNHLEEFLRQFKWVLSSRELFGDWQRQQVAGGLTDIQKAARYYYLQRHAFGGKVSGRTFGVAVDRKPRINLVRIEEELSAVYLRLVGVVIENLPWQEFLKRYDREDIFFYLDPPYWKAPHYNHNITRIEEFQEMGRILKGLKGRFILSINDHPDIWEVFRPHDFYIKQVSLDYTVSSKNHTRAKELLISNVQINDNEKEL